MISTYLFLLDIYFIDFSAFPPKKKKLKEFKSICFCQDFDFSIDHFLTAGYTISKISRFKVSRFGKSYKRESIKSLQPYYDSLPFLNKIQQQFYNSNFSQSSS